MMTASNNDITSAARTLADARYVIALVGAGMSVESGIPPFRGAGGLWTKHGEPPMDGYQRFIEDPAAGWRDMLARRTGDSEFARALAAAAPNDGHLAMAELESMGVLRHTITQNIDNLHYDAGSVAVTEIHGNRTKVRCLDCGGRWRWDDVNVDAERLPPSCAHCGGILKSDTVMFGEPIPRDALRECDEQASRADCCLIVGTSATVYPAAAYPEHVLRGGGAIVEVNTEETPFTPYAAVSLRGPSAVLLPRLVAAVREARRQGADGR